MTVCEGFQWIGQTLASCDRCGQPYWEHTHEEVPAEDQAFGGTWKLVPIPPEKARAVMEKWVHDV